MSTYSSLSRQRAEVISARQGIPMSWKWGASRDAVDAQAIPRCSRSDPIPLSYAQERIWFLDQPGSGSSTHSISVAYRVRGQLDVPALERSLDAIVRRHEVLRTTFSSVNGYLVQVIAQTVNLALPVANLRELSETEQEAEVWWLVAEEAQEPFDLAQGPLLRVKLLCLSQEEHVFVLSMHHIVSDDWSIVLVLRELAVLYEAFSAGEALQLPELSIQYADFAHWQRRQMQGERLASELEYLRQQLGSEQPVLRLPIDRSRPPSRTPRGAHHTLMLPRALTEALKALSRREGITLFVTLLAACKVLLYRYTDQEHIFVGSPVSVRDQVETEALIGPFTNTVVLHTKLSGSLSFRELLGRVHRVVSGAHSHRGLPLEELVEQLQPELDLRRPVLVQAGFRMVDSADRRIELVGLKVEQLPIPGAISELDLTLWGWTRDEDIELELVYNADLYARDRMVEMLDQFKHLLAQVVEYPDASIQSYSLVTPRARRLLPDPSEALPEPWYEPITTVFASWLDGTAERAAVRQGGRAWTYGELGRSSSALAQALLVCGVKRGDVVAVSGTRSFGVIVSMVAALLCHGVLLNLDLNLPRRRQELMLLQAKAKWMLYVGTPRTVDGWMRERITVIHVDPDSGQATDPVETMPREDIKLPQVTPEDAAYLFFTSGTTGVPKGVLGCHKGLSQFLSWQQQTFALGPSDSSAQLTGLSFDVILRDVFTPLSCGATLCLPIEEDRLEPARLLSWMERERISMLHIVPSLAQSWLPSVPAGVSLRALRWVFFAGEPLTETLVRRWRKAFPESGEIVNLYGPTETTLAKCHFLVPREPLPGVQPVGSALPETQALVFTKENQLCGIGEPGEIVIRTPFRSLGYIDASEESQRRFVKNPFRDDERDLLYFTGDGGRYRPDGTLDILGRVDHQVKLRGVRIELGGIEAVLSQHPAVWDSVVLVREDVPGDRRLVAYVTTRPNHTLAADELRGLLKQNLPSPMVPSAIVELDALPLTQNGKVDRQALPAPEGLRPELARSYAPPQTEMERSIATLWQDVLHIERAGVDDNFFDLGGHSLLLIQLQGKLQEFLDSEVSVVELFKYPTISSLARHLSQEQGERPGLQHVHDRAQVRRELMSRRRRSAASSRQRIGETQE